MDATEKNKLDQFKVEYISLQGLKRVILRSDLNINGHGLHQR